MTWPPPGIKWYYHDSATAIACAKFENILPLLPDSSVDMIWTDPPYGHNNNFDDLACRRECALGIRKATTKQLQDDGTARPIANDGEEAGPLVRSMFHEAKRILKPGCCCCCCCGGGGPDPQFARWSLWMDEIIGFKQMIIWDKGGLGMGWHYRRNYETVLVGEKPGAACHWYGGNSIGNVIRINGIKPTLDDHPTPKPVKLPGLFIQWHTIPGELIVDPFMGGGPSLVAAKQLGRLAIGIDVSEEWCEQAARRLAQEVLPLDTKPPVVQSQGVLEWR